ncbi:hypothetical protein HKBW3S09_01084 [Candidatus Hakubella thermalkaliphila]|uniref:Uncharacterized protein n=2 Tax=Candidatus Hakubella thermalkaliphila TaxID=2754717 RepID=A0A6V8PAF4_9ACTN|nr:hypothetical protein HKBW3S09_01084 [Candidatus Hakubella thermalkaliphila]GFP29662.1 hypothetical protein HKBW3S34_00582 [Candidatus Hakubella thermalkaliphila]
MLLFADLFENVIFLLRNAYRFGDHFSLPSIFLKSSLASLMISLLI